MNTLRHQCLTLMDWCGVTIARHGAPIDLSQIDDRHLPDVLTLLKAREEELLWETLPEPEYIKKAQHI